MICLFYISFWFGVGVGSWISETPYGCVFAVQSLHLFYFNFDGSSPFHSLNSSKWTLKSLVLIVLPVFLFFSLIRRIEEIIIVNLI